MISGVVTAENAQPLGGVTVTVKAPTALPKLMKRADLPLVLLPGSHWFLVMLVLLTKKLVLEPTIL